MACVATEGFEGRNYCGQIAHMAFDSENTRTEGWEAVNNERRLGVSEPDHAVEVGSVADDWDGDWHLDFDESIEHGERSKEAR